MKLFCILILAIFMASMAFGQTAVACQDGISDNSVLAKLQVSEEMHAGKKVPVVNLGLYNGYTFTDTRIVVNGKPSTSVELKKLHGQKVTAKIRMRVSNGKCPELRGMPGTFTSLEIRTIKSKSPQKLK